MKKTRNISLVFCSRVLKVPHISIMVLQSPNLSEPLVLLLYSVTTLFYIRNHTCWKHNCKRGTWGGGESKNPRNDICSFCQMHQLLGSDLQGCDEVSQQKKWKTFNYFFIVKNKLHRIQYCLEVPVSSRNELAWISEAILLQHIIQYGLLPCNIQCSNIPQVLPLNSLGVTCLEHSDNF